MRQTHRLPCRDDFECLLDCRTANVIQSGAELLTSSAVALLRSAEVFCVLNDRLYLIDFTVWAGDRRGQCIDLLRYNRVSVLVRLLNFLNHPSNSVILPSTASVIFAPSSEIFSTRMLPFSSRMTLRSSEILPSRIFAFLDYPGTHLLQAFGERAFVGCVGLLLGNLISGHFLAILGDHLVNGRDARIVGIGDCLTEFA